MLGSRSRRLFRVDAFSSNMSTVSPSSTLGVNVRSSMFPSGPSETCKPYAWRVASIFLSIYSDSLEDSEGSTTNRWNIAG